MRFDHWMQLFQDLLQKWANYVDVFPILYVGIIVELFCLLSWYTLWIELDTRHRIKLLNKNLWTPLEPHILIGRSSLKFVQHLMVKNLNSHSRSYWVESMLKNFWWFLLVPNREQIDCFHLRLNQQKDLHIFVQSQQNTQVRGIQMAQFLERLQWMSSLNQIRIEFGPIYPFYQRHHQHHLHFHSHMVYHLWDYNHHRHYNWNYHIHLQLYLVLHKGFRTIFPGFLIPVPA